MVVTFKTVAKFCSAVCKHWAKVSLICWNCCIVEVLIFRLIARLIAQSITLRVWFPDSSNSLTIPAGLLSSRWWWNGGSSGGPSGGSSGGPSGGSSGGPSGGSPRPKPKNGNPNPNSLPKYEMQCSFSRMKFYWNIQFISPKTTKTNAIRTKVFMPQYILATNFLFTNQ